MVNDEGPDLEPVDVTREQPATASSSWPAGWYADAWTAGQYRYWNGSGWTGETRRWGPNASQPHTAPPTVEAVTRPWPAWSSTTTDKSAPPTAVLPPGVPVPAPRESRGGGPRAPMIAGVIALVLLMIVSGVVGYLLVPHSHHSTASGSGPTPTPTPTAPASNGTDPDRGALAGVVVRQQDVGAGRPVLLLGSGMSQPTLDLCNGRFPSEALRTARLQVVETDSTGSAVFSTEAVLYHSPAAAQQAFAELRSVVAACPHAPVKSPVGEPTVTTTFQAAPDTGWPQMPTVQRLAYHLDTVSGRTKSSSIAVYLRRGRALIGLYFSNPTVRQSPVDGRATIEGIVGVFAARLAALPSSVVDSTH